MDLRWTKRAAKDLAQICDYTESHFGMAQAGRAGRVVYSAAESLKEMPLLGRAGRKSGTRELIIAGFPFIIIYRARTECVELLRILHAAQRWP
jgi:toxin ParE1/3/4